MVLHTGVGLRENSFQVSVMPWLWKLCPKLQKQKLEEELEKEKDEQWTQV